MSRSRVLILVFMLAAGVIVPAALAASRLAFNATPSLSRGFYYVSPAAPLERGQIVMFAVPESVRQLVVDRRYLPVGADLFKRIVGLPGDQVCVQDGTFTVNGISMGAVLEHDLMGLALPIHRFCGLVPEGQIYVANSGHPRSFDSRYFGPVPVCAIKGVLKPLWTF